MRGWILATILVSGLLFVPAATAQVQPYNESDGNVTLGNWTENRTTVDASNTSHYFGRIGSFLIGDDPSDPGIGPFLTGMLVVGFSISMLGTSRSGLIASGTMGTIVIAGLAAPSGAGLLPRWLYAVVVLLFAFIGGALYLKAVK